MTLARRNSSKSYRIIIPYMYKKFLLGYYAVIGYVYKILVDTHIINIPIINMARSENVIVSLTSYGRRVRTNVVYYTLVSLLRQKVQPAHIVLWLAQDEWNDNTIPPKLKRLKEKGIEICYCEDIKSYKKIIPSLKKFPESTIITVDDDMIYSKDTLATLWELHKTHPEDIICTAARKPIIKDGLPLDYTKWEDSLLRPFENGTKGQLLFPVGVGGVLYPHGSLHEDVLKENLFMKYCPNADDVWLWFCGLRANSTKRYVKKRGRDLSFDSLYQYFHKGSALTHNNNLRHENDRQIEQLFSYFKYRID